VTEPESHPSPWYVCRTKPRQEPLAASKLQEQGYEVFLPMLDKWARKKGIWSKAQQVMFPRYGFVRCGRPGQSLAPIRSTPGVTGLVAFGNSPATLDEALVEAIRSVANAQAAHNKEEIFPFQTGGTVEICAGPLSGLTGIVSSVADERVTVLLSLLGRDQPVVLSANHLSPA